MADLRQTTQVPGPAPEPTPEAPQPHRPDVPWGEANAMTAGLGYRVLGPFEVVRDGQPVDLGPPQQRALLAVLVLHANELVSLDRLTDLLWDGRPSRTASHAVQVYVSALRRVLGAQAIITRAPGYVLRTRSGQLDTEDVEQLVDEALRAAQAGDHATAADRYEQALSVWRGPPLADFQGDGFAAAEAHRLEDVRLTVLEGLAQELLEVGRAADAVQVSTTAVREAPLRERPRMLLMLALYRDGRYAEALMAYQDFYRTLDDELGLVPSGELQRLQEHVLLHDPVLTGAGRPVPARAEPGAVPHRNPYKGLRPFSENDAEDFFGRSAAATELRDRLELGTPVVALLGPSGSGKSSLVRAGLLPLLARAEGESWNVAVVLPGPTPVNQLRAAVERTGTGADRSLVVVDQLEELYTRADETERRQFLDVLVSTASAPGRHVLVTLRGDFYDRPFEHRAFAELFTAGVVNLLPMTAAELEQAVVEPAGRVGVTVEPGLLAELVAETTAAPGALPQLQYALAETFDQRDGSALTLDTYHRLGGVARAITQGADRLFLSLGRDLQEVVRQVLLRLVVPGAGHVAQRRVPLRELLDLGIDAVDLQEVLDQLVTHRLVTVDRDAVSGAATVEVAHEALLREWPRARGWVEEYRQDLSRRDSLVRAMSEWEASDRHPDFLLSGERLTGYVSWSERSAIRLTGPERDYVRMSLDRHRTDREAEEARRRHETRLLTRARRRLWGLAAAVAATAAALAFAVAAAQPDPPPRVALAGEGVGAGDYSDQVFSGFRAAAERLGLTGRAVEWASVEDVVTMSEEGVGLVLLPSTITLDVEELADRFPDTHYVLLEGPDPGTRDNVSSIMFAANQGSYLAGMAAALTSTTGHVGFVGGVDTPVIYSFQAGYEAGVRAVDPDARIDVVYLTPWGDFSGFSSATLGELAATLQFGAGADVVFHAAGGSGAGVLRAASAFTAAGGRHVWVIGADTDQYHSFPAEYDADTVERLRPHVLTSMVKRMDVAIAGVLERYRAGELAAGPVEFTYASGAMELATSGGHLDAHLDRLRAAEHRLTAGDLVVPADISGPPPLLSDLLRSDVLRDAAAP